LGFLEVKNLYLLFLEQVLLHLETLLFNYKGILKGNGFLPLKSKKFFLLIIRVGAIII
jgi:hypothetical protein